MIGAMIKMAHRQLKKPSYAGDDFQTPNWAVDLLVDNYLALTEYKRVWECASGGGSLAARLRQHKYQVIETDIEKGTNFIPSLITNDEIARNDYDIIITNPPYSKKNSFIFQCAKLKKPFALLLPLTALESAKRHLIWREGLFLLIPNRRVNFYKLHWDQTMKAGGAWFPVGWFICGPDIKKCDIKFCDCL